MIWFVDSECQLECTSLSLSRTKGAAHLRQGAGGREGARDQRRRAALRGARRPDARRPMVQERRVTRGERVLSGKLGIFTRFTISQG